jgi:hypothetical protein
MWPFTSPKRVLDELRRVTREEFDDVVHRLKIVEREHDDLHAAYRRLRAARAGEAPHETKKGNQGDSGQAESYSDRAPTKEELRKRFLMPGFGPRKDGMLE